MKNVLITGATGGIGSKLVNIYHSKGYNICALGTNAQKLKSLNNLYNDKIKTYCCDMSLKEEINITYEKISKDFKLIDILINNAGITKDNLFIRMSESDWFDVMNINFLSHVHLTKLVLKGMMKNKWGRIVSISSEAAKIGNAGQANYVSSKGALEAFTRTLANEVAKRGITVNCVAPGFIQTEIIESVNKVTLNKLVENIPMGEIGKASDVANAVFFLTREESSYITGQILRVNGGLTM